MEPPREAEGQAYGGGMPETSRCFADVAYWGTFVGQGVSQLGMKGQNRKLLSAVVDALERDSVKEKTG